MYIPEVQRLPPVPYVQSYRLHQSASLDVASLFFKSRANHLNPVLVESTSLEYLYDSTTVPESLSCNQRMLYEFRVIARKVVTLHHYQRGH